MPKNLRLPSVRISVWAIASILHIRGFTTICHGLIPANIHPCSIPQYVAALSKCKKKNTRKTIRNGY